MHDPTQISKKTHLYYRIALNDASNYIRDARVYNGADSNDEGRLCPTAAFDFALIFDGAFFEKETEMSTFDGIIHEFPNIRIDFFRTRPNKTPPLACFLSHVHSDHLQGLEALSSPFVYCSAATRRLILRMEKYPQRINYAKGILEARKQTYRHLKQVLKTLPLQTPTELELAPQLKIRVTLFDANHCPGSVMFLIEGNGKAVLYTGDIRSESWWINSIARHPVMIPYTLGGKILDCVYMDTTFATKDNVYQDFPSKSTGLAELLDKVQQYPPDTTFYFRAWTLGYEDVWLALSSLLGSQIHVDLYQERLYTGLMSDDTDGFSIPEAPALVGFRAGNHLHAGCLTHEKTARIHSCEPGTECYAAIAKKHAVVYITPIISRLPDGTEVREIGAGGGGGDLYQTPDLDYKSADSLQSLRMSTVNCIKDQKHLTEALEVIDQMAKHGNSKPPLEAPGFDLETVVKLKDLFDRISPDFVCASTPTEALPQCTLPSIDKLTTSIHFPYSRHSSYNELRHLISAFHPKDICPCTVDLDTWTEDISMESLFGDLCSAKLFVHDAENRADAEQRRTQLAQSRKRRREVDDDDDGDTQRSDVEGSDDSFTTHESPTIPARIRGEATNEARAAYLEAIKTTFHAMNNGRDTISEDLDRASPPASASLLVPDDPMPEFQPEVLDDDENNINLQNDSPPLSAFSSQSLIDAQTSPCSSPRLRARREAYRAAKACLDSGESSAWDDLGIRSLGHRGHMVEEVEL